MNLTDIIALALRNLRQAKLRTALTVVGVVVGVAAIITMVSFGLGLQQNIIVKTFARMDVFTSITVFGPSAEQLIAMSENRPRAEDGADSGGAKGNRRVLDDAAIAEMAKLKGVKYALPVINFQCFARYGERTRRLRVGGATASVEDNPRFKKLLAGKAFSGDDANEAIMTEGILARAWFASSSPPPSPSQRRRPPPMEGRPGGPFVAGSAKSDEERAREAQQAIGKEIVLLTLRRVESSGPDSVFGIPLLTPPGRNGNAGDGADEAEGSDRYERHVFRVVGVLPTETGLNMPMLAGADLYIPMEQARRFREANRDPMEKLGEALAGDSGYQRAEVRVSDPTQVVEVQKEIEKLGFNSFSLNNQVDEIKRVFLIINGGLALIGGIALLVASFGIANTMIMSILERTREIGIMKAIGGGDGEIMRIFFFEASLIGLLGGSFGVLAGWVVDRIANFAVNRWMLRQNEHIEFFSIPWYLWNGAILFAIAISLIAAIYPALRAARVDPIRALRHD
ncbi:MAG TPA: FtsX-like permease family protein [Blastocatellia bacterium]|nr:FtsX-like permease family protein [Blastocatellia bacterium]